MIKFKGRRSGQIIRYPAACRVLDANNGMESSYFLFQDNWQQPLSASRRHRVRFTPVLLGKRKRSQVVIKGRRSGETILCYSPVHDDDDDEDHVQANQGLPRQDVLFQNHALSDVLASKENNSTRATTCLLTKLFGKDNTMTLPWETLVEGPVPDLGDNPQQVLPHDDASQISSRSDSAKRHKIRHDPSPFQNNHPHDTEGFDRSPLFDRGNGRNRENALANHTFTSATRLRARNLDSDLAAVALTPADAVPINLTSRVEAVSVVGSLTRAAVETIVDCESTCPVAGRADLDQDYLEQESSVVGHDNPPAVAPPQPDVETCPELRLLPHLPDGILNTLPLRNFFFVRGSSVSIDRQKFLKVRKSYKDLEDDRKKCRTGKEQRRKWWAEIYFNVNDQRTWCKRITQVLWGGIWKSKQVEVLKVGNGEQLFKKAFQNALKRQFDYLKPLVQQARDQVAAQNQA